MDERTFIEGLDPAQREAVTTAASPLCILAGAGSGKTRVLTRRIGYRVASGSADPRHVLALTFTRKAANELQHRLGSLSNRLQVAAGTFHSVAFCQLRRWWAERGERHPVVLERKVSLLASLLGQRCASVQPIEVAQEIEWAKARMLTPDSYVAEATRKGRSLPLPPSELAELFSRYEVDKRRRGLVDFDDLLSLCAQAVEGDPDLAAKQRWRFRHLFVDEFQDVNPLQFRLLEAWRGGRDDLCVVGDFNQAVYAWNGADASYLRSFRRHFPGATTISLHDNYRSSPQILAVAAGVLGRGEGKPLLRPNRPAGPVPATHSYETDEQEARRVARALRDLHSPTTPWSHLAVLARTNAQLVLFQEALRATGIPYRVRGGGAFLEQPEIRQALNDLRRSPPAVPLASLIADLQSHINETETEAASKSEGYFQRRLELDALVRLAKEYAELDPMGSAHGFLAWLDTTVRTDEPDRDANAVDLVTFHRAKGLEWPVVFLVGLERGLVPIGHASTAEAIAEERRLLYVAVTRAQTRLYCSWASQRTFGTRTLSRTPSPWLESIQATCQYLEGSNQEVDWRKFVESGRSRLETTHSRRRRRGPAVTLGTRADPRVLQELKAWRTRAARAAGVPAHVIFHDATLAAVAEARPMNRSALLALPGLGPAKADRYGEALLAVVARHAASA